MEEGEGEEGEGGKGGEEGEGERVVRYWESWPPGCAVWYEYL